MTSRVPISFACGLYACMEALYTGEIRPEGIDLNFIVHNHTRDVFDRMAGGHEFDCSEMSLSEYVCWYINSHTIKYPKDLNGKKIGVQLYTMTAAVWIRSLLKQYNVDLDTITWIEGSMESPEPHGKPTILPPLKPIAITNTTTGKSSSQLLEEGEIEATIGANLLPRHFGKAPHIKRLFPEFKEAEKEYYTETGIFPIMHTVVIRTDIVEKHPFVATGLFDALNDAKDLAFQRTRFLDVLRYMFPWLASEINEIDQVFGGDPWPYGIEKNRKTLGAAVECLFNQGMIERKVSLDDLFLEPRGQNWKIGWGPVDVVR